jgi:phosphoribosyl 1,2-cyclic phosphodiesterase
MKITIWGCRGSITSPGKETIRYGGESTCLEILTDEDEVIIVDAGSGIRKLGHKIPKESTNTDLTLMFTHSHWDHLAGFPFFRPAFMSRYTIKLCGGPVAQKSILKSLQHQMEPPYFPVDMSEMKAVFKKGCQCGYSDCGNRLPCTKGSPTCESIPLNHPNGGYGFKFSGTSGKPFVFLTDNEIQYKHESGRSRDEYVAFCQNADLLFHDAQYTEEEYKRTRTWGHSTYKDAVDLAIDAGVRRLGLFHHDPDRSDDDVDFNLKWCKDYIKEKNGKLECFACAEGLSFTV